MVERWLAYALACLAFWGLWGLVLKIAQRMLGEWYEVYIASNMAVVIAVIIVWLTHRGSLHIEPLGALAALSAGTLGTLGYAFLVLSLNSGGPASIVIPLTALYPAITAVLAVLLLGEKMDMHQMVGVVLAVIAIYLISYTRG